MALADPPVHQSPPPPRDGDRLDQVMFHARYEAMPDGVRAELIGGQVFMPPPPVSADHGLPHSNLVFWLKTYKRFTRGVEVFDNSTARLGQDSEPQPDASLNIKNGGQTRLVPGKSGARYVTGAPELVAELSFATDLIDLREKPADYKKYGVIEYVVVLVGTGEVRWFKRTAGKLAAIDPDADGLFKSDVFPGPWLDPVGLIADDEERLIAAVEKGVAAPPHAAFVTRLVPQLSGPARGPVA